MTSAHQSMPKVPCFMCYRMLPEGLLGGLCDDCFGLYGNARMAPSPLKAKGQGDSQAHALGDIAVADESGPLQSGSVQVESDLSPPDQVGGFPDTSSD
jgi:hypothetical protein